MKKGFVVLVIAGCAGFLTAGCGSSQPAPQTTTTAANLGPTLTLPNQDVASAGTTTTAATTTTAPVHGSRTHGGDAKSGSSGSGGSSGTGYSGVQPGSGGAHSGYSGVQPGSGGAHSGYSGVQSGSGGAQSGYSGVQSGSGGAQSGYSGASSDPSTSASSSAAPSSGGTTTVVHTVTVVHRVIVTKTKTKTKTKIKTKTETKTRTKIKTVVQVKTVQAPPPAVPQGAFPPAQHSPMHLSAFRTVDGAIGCSVAGGTARCDIGSRTWTPPAKPSSCSLAWGQGLSVGPSGTAHFVCAGDTALDPSGPVVKNGQDDAVGSLTCQVRNVGVACFDKAGEGFFIARTGYTMF
jgi:hypothetical protein